MAKDFVKFSVSKEMAAKTYSTLELVKKDGKIRIGTNESTKAIEGNAALLVVIAEDVEPQEIVMHLPLLCREKKIPFTYVPSKKELGQACGVEVSTAAITVVKEGNSKKEFKALLDSVHEAAKNAR